MDQRFAKSLSLTSAPPPQFPCLYLAVPGWYMHLVYAPEIVYKGTQYSVSYPTFCVSPPPSKLAIDFRFFHHIVPLSMGLRGPPPICYMLHMYTSTIYIILTRPPHPH